MRAVSAVISRSPRKFESMSRRCVMPANISGLRMEVNWYYTGINMQPAAHPSSTLMFAEASEAGQIVAKQLSENAVLAKELAKLLQIGRASCRESVWTYGKRPGVAVSVKKK